MYSNGEISEAIKDNRKRFNIVVQQKKQDAIAGMAKPKAYYKKRKTILRINIAALEQYQNPPSNKEAKSALDRMSRHCDYRQAEMDYKTIKTAINTAPKIDIDELIQKHIKDTGNTSGLVVFEWLVKEGILNEK